MPKVATAATFGVTNFSLRFGRGDGREKSVATSDEPATTGSTAALLQRVTLQGRYIER